MRDVTGLSHIYKDKNPWIKIKYIDFKAIKKISKEDNKLNKCVLKV